MRRLNRKRWKKKQKKKTDNYFQLTKLVITGKTRFRTEGFGISRYNGHSVVRCANYYVIYNSEQDLKIPINCLEPQPTVLQHNLNIF